MGRVGRGANSGTGAEDDDENHEPNSDEVGLGLLRIEEKDWALTSEIDFVNEDLDACGELPGDGEDEFIGELILTFFIL